MNLKTTIKTIQKGKIGQCIHSSAPCNPCSEKLISRWYNIVLFCIGDIKNKMREKMDAPIFQI